MFTLPSLEVNASAILTDSAAILKFMTAGKATFTLRSRESGVRYTYKMTKKDGSDDFWFVNRLSGPDNNDDYFYIGYVRQVRGEGFLAFGAKAGRGHEISVKAFEWYLCRLQQKPEHAIASVEFWHEGRCGRCNRKLTVPESIESGFGPECINYV